MRPRSVAGGAPTSRAVHTREDDGSHLPSGLTTILYGTSRRLSGSCSRTNLPVPWRHETGRRAAETRRRSCAGGDAHRQGSPGVQPARHGLLRVPRRLQLARSASSGAVAGRCCRERLESAQARRCGAVRTFRSFSESARFGKAVEHRMRGVPACTAMRPELEGPGYGLRLTLRCSANQGSMESCRRVRLGAAVRRRAESCSQDAASCSVRRSRMVSSAHGCQCRCHRSPLTASSRLSPVPSTLTGVVLSRRYTKDSPCLSARTV